MVAEPFIIDLNDPADLVVKLGEARAIVEVKEQELARFHDLEREVRKWRSVVAFLLSQLPSEPDMASASNGNGRRLKPMDLVVDVVNREVRPIRAKEVRRILLDEGHQLSSSAVSNALHYAVTGAKKIVKAEGRGMYAPLGYREPQLPDPPATGPTQAQPVGDARADGTRTG
jgi:hypothetical protein